jgi:hypothetical protein
MMTQIEWSADEGLKNPASPLLTMQSDGMAILIEIYFRIRYADHNLNKARVHITNPGFA